MEFAFSAGFFGATSLFISRVGTFSLFYIYFGSSILALGLSYVFSKIIDRYSRRIIFFGSFLILGFLVIVGWALIGIYPESKALYFGMRIFSYSILVLTGLEFWVLASLSFNHADSKDVFAKLVVVTIFGEMMGGLFTGFASKWIGTQNLLLLWGLSLCLTPFLFLRFSFPRPETAGFSTGVVWGEVQAPGTGFRSRSFFSSHFIQLLFLFWIGYSFICYGTDYVFNSFAAETIIGEDALTEFFGRVAAAASFVVLLYHLLIGPKLTHRLGPTQNLILLSAVMVAPWIAFGFHPSLITVAIADGMVYYFSDHFATGIYSSILTVFPERVKGRIRVLTEGFGRPLGTVLLFVVAAAFAFKVSVAQMHYWMLGATILFFAFPILFRKPYGKHLLNCLHSRDPSLVLNSVQALSESPQDEAIDPLTTLLHESKNLDLRRSVVWALEHIPKPEAMRQVMPILENPKDPLHGSAIEGLRHCPEFQGIYTLLGILMQKQEKDRELRVKSLAVMKDLLGKEVIVLLLAYLYDSDPKVQCDALKALASFRDRRLIPIYLPFLKNSDPQIRAGACIALYPFSRSREKVRQLALLEIEALATSENPEEKLAGFDAIGASHLVSYRELLRRNAKTGEKRIALGAAASLAHLRDLWFIGPYLEMLGNADEAFAIEAGKLIPGFPESSRRALFRRIEQLDDVPKAKIQNRLKKTREDFSRDMGSHREHEPFMTVQIHA